MTTTEEPANGGPYGDIGVRIRSLLPSFTPAERLVAQHVLTDPEGTVALTITELAARCRTSLPTVTRFCRALGLQGYPQLRLALAADSARSSSRGWTGSVSADIEPDDPPEKILSNLAEVDARAIHDTATQLDLHMAEQVISAMTAAPRIDIYAVGGSWSVGREMHMRLVHIGRVSHAWMDVHEALSSAVSLRPGDVALGISYSGETSEVIEPLQTAAARGATTVAITNFPKSPVAGVADLVLTTAARTFAFRSGGLSARHAQLVVLDFLYIGVARRTQADSERAFAAASSAVDPHRTRTLPPGTPPGGEHHRDGGDGQSPDADLAR